MINKSVLLLLIVITVSSCRSKHFSSNQRLDQLGTYEYPFLGLTIDHYFRSYYRYPHSLDDYIAYMKMSDSYYKEYFNLQPMYTKLEKNKKNIRIKENKEHYILIENDSIEILKLNKINICQKLNNDRFEYGLMNNILFFKNQKLVVDDSSNSKEKLDKMRKRLSFLKHKLSFQAHDWELIHYTKDTIVYDCGKMDLKVPHPDTERMKDTLAVLMQEHEADSLVLVIPVAPVP